MKKFILILSFLIFIGLISFGALKIFHISIIKDETFGIVAYDNSKVVSTASKFPSLKVGPSVDFYKKKSFFKGTNKGDTIIGILQNHLENGEIKEKIIFYGEDINDLKTFWGIDEDYNKVEIYWKNTANQETESVTLDIAKDIYNSKDETTSPSFVYINMGVDDEKLKKSFKDVTISSIDKFYDELVVVVANTKNLDDFKDDKINELIDFAIDNSENKDLIAFKEHYSKEEWESIRNNIPLWWEEGCISYSRRGKVNLAEEYLPITAEVPEEAKEAVRIKSQRIK